MDMNGKKAREIAFSLVENEHDTCWTDCYYASLDMAEYKDAQFKEQKELIKMSLKDEIFPYIIPSKRDKIGSIIDRIFDVNLDE